jgi:predicted dienelactone hydrolase
MRFVATLLFAAASVIASAAPTNNNQVSDLTLPIPSGKFPVGRVTYFWSDSSRPEPLSPTPANREVMVFVWYPAAKSTSVTIPAPYFPDFKVARAAISDGDFKGLFRPADQQIQKIGLPQTHASEGASMPAGSTRYPVLVFSHGWGLQTPVYTASLEDLASHGYVVVAIDHPYDTTATIFPDGRIAKFAQDKFDAAAKKPHGYIDYADERIEVMASDVRFVIDELARYDKDPQLGAPFAGHLDSSRIGAFGHSIGGMTAARACEIDARIRACIDEDSIDDVGSPFSVITPGSLPKKPFLLFIAASADIFSTKAVHPSDEDLAKQKLTRAQYDQEIEKQQKKQNELLRAIGGGVYRVMLFDLPGITHRSFSDLPLLASGDDASKLQEAVHNFQIIQEYILGFFDKYLKGDQNTVLDRKTTPDANIQVERFGLANTVTLRPATN